MAALAAAPARELVAAQWDLVPHWIKSASDGRLRALKRVNARSENVSTAQAFRDAWLRGQRCIVPMEAFFEDGWGRDPLPLVDGWPGVAVRAVRRSPVAGCIKPT